MTFTAAGPQPVSGQPNATHGGYVPVAAVARQVTEYVEVAGHGVFRLTPVPKRALARIVDGLIIVIAFFLLTGFFFQSGLILDLILIALMANLYEFLMVGIIGRTVGKIAIGARIIRSADGTKPKFTDSFMRWLLPGVVGLLPILGALGSPLVLISPVFDSSGRRQGWHDKIASTLVVQQV
ncbi:RDD family protein [Arthrobacter terricola]|nr:RDD family protein [Arthrobacter terricola]